MEFTKEKALVRFQYITIRNIIIVPLWQIPFSEGRILLGGDEYPLEYCIKDHLGNVRVSFEPTANNTITLTQKDYYYPFGLRVTKVHPAAKANRYL